MHRRSIAALTALALIATATPALADDEHRFGSRFAATSRGPNTTTDPYMIPAATGVRITSILTVNDSESAENGYEFVGIPDGIGVYSEDGKVVALVNHELRDTNGIVRRHGQRGAFVSRLVIDPRTLKVVGTDLVDPGVRYWDYPTGTYVTSGPKFSDGSTQDLTFGRFCSGTLSDPGIFYSEPEDVGYRGQIYFGNEEDGDNGRTFGILTDGTAKALPRLGLFSWENTIPANNRGRTTLVMGQEDGPRDGSQPWVYVGTKQNTGDAFDRAGLTNGRDFVLDAVNPLVTDDITWRATFGKSAAPVRLVEIPWNQTGTAQNVEAKAKGLSLNRIEDGYWDPKNRNDFYFLTTEGGDKTTSTAFPYPRDGGGVWLLRWADVDRPELGATLRLLLDGTEEIGRGEPRLNNPDNMVIDRRGNLLIQEDPGGSVHVARIVAYRIKDGALGVVARFDPDLFSPGGSQFITSDEESSGIVDTEKLFGERTFLFDAQIHTSSGLAAGTGPGTVQEYVENGQLMLLRVSSWHQVYDEDDDEDEGDDADDDDDGD